MYENMLWTGEDDYTTIYRFSRKLLYKRPLIVNGFFAAGKTRRTAKAVQYLLDRAKTNPKLRRYVFVFALPLRQLRSQVYETYFSKLGFEFRAHDEVCVAMRDRAKECDGRDNNRGCYLVKLAEHLQAVKNGEETCGYIQHLTEFKQYITGGGQVVVTTHQMGIIATVMLKVLKKQPILIIDEAEDFLLTLARGVSEDVLKVLELVDKEYASRVKRNLERNVEAYYMRKSTLKAALKDSVLVSATFPRALKKVLFILTGWQVDETWVQLSGDVVQDVAVFYKGVLDYTSMEEWVPELISQIVELVRVGVDKYGIVGIVAKRKEVNKQVVETLRQIGYRVVHDEMPRREFTTQLKDAQVVVLTTRGKLYRGVNILPSGVDDVPLIVGVYQGSYEREDHPYLQELMTTIDDYHLLRQYRKELNYAKNLQAIYRFNRRPDRRHVLVLYDWRFHQAFYHFYRNKLYNMLVRVEVDDLKRVADVAKQYI